MNFVCHHRLTVARSAKNNPAFAFAARDRFRRRTNEQRIIDRIFAKGSAIFHFMTERGEKLLHLFLVTKTGVIGAEGDFHCCFVKPAALRLSMSILQTRESIWS